MKTADLIAALAADTSPEPTRAIGWRIAAFSCAGITLAGAMVAVLFGLRPDLAQAGGATAMKASFGLIAALVLAPLVLHLSKPNIRMPAAAFAVFVFVGVCAIATAAHLMMAQSLAPLGLSAGVPECLKRVPMLAIPIAAILFLVVRSFAPTRLTLAGAAIGAFSGGLAIIPYALFCPMDSVAYVATWYLSSLVVSAALGAVIGARALRWI